MLTMLIIISRTKETIKLLVLKCHRNGHSPLSVTDAVLGCFSTGYSFLSKY